MAEDPELARIRAQRMAQMQQQGGGGQDVQKQQEMAQKQAEMKNTMLAQILDQGARARLNSIALVKPEKAGMIENMLIQMAQRGQVAGRMNEEGLIQVLARVNEQTESKNKVTINRRRYAMDSDDNDY